MSAKLDEKELKRLRRNTMIWKFVFIGVSLIVAVLAFIIGLLLGRSMDKDDDPEGSGYPYAAISLFALPAPKGPGLIMTSMGLIACSSFFFGLHPLIFGNTATYYNVYHRRGSMIG